MATQLTEADPFFVGNRNASEKDRAVPSKLVYVVDDDSMVRRSLSFLLRAAGFHCRVFASGGDFLGEVNDLSPGCVLLDVRMPEMDGIEVLDSLGVLIDRFVVVVMTGHGDVDIAVRAMKHGASDFLEKPFTETALTEALKFGFLTLPAQVQAHTERDEAVTLAATLTPRERDVLQGLVAGQSNKVIAELLGVGVRTVEMHRGRLMSRLRTRTVVDAVRVAHLASIGPLQDLR